MKRITVLLDDQLYRQLVGFSSDMCKGRVEKMNLSKGIRELLEKQLKMEESDNLPDMMHKRSRLPDAYESHPFS